MSHTISPHVWDFFSEHQNDKCSRYPFLQLFRTRVLYTHKGGHKAACIVSALSKFHPSFKDSNLALISVPSLARFMVASHMKNHPPATQEDADKMMRTEEVLASSSNLAVVEKIPQVRRTFSLLALISGVVCS